MNNLLSNKEEKLADHPRTLKEIAAYYGVGTKVVRAWLRKYHLDDLADRRHQGLGYYYTIAELRRMAEILGD